MLRAPASHTIGSNFDMVRADTSNSLGTCLALLQAAGSHSIRSNCDMVRTDASTRLDLVRRTASGHAWLSCGRLAHTSLAPAGPWCIRLPVWKKCPHFRQSMLRAPVSHTIGTDWAMVRTDASTSLGTCLAGPESWLPHHRQQLVPWTAQMPRSASARSLRCCGMLVRTPSAPAAPWCAQIPRPASAHALAAAVRNLAYHRHHLVLGAPDASAHAWLG